MVGTKKRHSFRRVFLLFIVPLLLFSTVISVFNTSPARAAATSREVKRIRGWLAFKAAHSCFHGWDWIGEDNVAKNKLGDKGDSRTVNVGAYFHNSRPGEIKCGEMVSESIRLQYWGYSSLADLLTDAGYTHKRGSYYAPEVPKSGGGTETRTGSAIWDALRKKGFTDAPENYLTPAEMYYLYHDSFTTGCQITGEKEISTVSEEIKQKALNNKDLYAHYSVLSPERNSTINTVSKATLTKSYGAEGVNYLFDKAASTPYDNTFSCGNSTMNKMEQKISEWAEKAVQRTAELAEEGKSSEEDENPAGTDPSSDPSSEDQEDACGIDKVGWMACPVTSLLATVMDNLYSFLASNFLQTETAQVNNEEVEKVWRSFRDIANVAFVIAFSA